MHLKKGPEDAMKFGNWWNNSYRRKVVKSVLSAGEILKKKEYWPLYLSFPSGNESLVKGRRTDEPTPNRYLRYIVTRYLRSFEQGRGLVSLDNVQPKIPFDSKHELVNAKYILDIPSGEIFDVESLKNKAGHDAMIPEEIIRKKPTIRSQLSDNSHIKSIVFFIKGRAAMILYANKEKIFIGQQYYGQSYQMFKISLKDKKFNSPPVITLSLKPAGDNEPAYLVGPFILKTE